ncbi:xyloside xylosyltransferase 1 isoform X1 [Callithrix jacchus]
MGLLRGGLPCARAMARLGAVRSHYCALLLAAALAVCAFYYLGSGRETFSSATKRLKEARAGGPAAPSPPALELARGSVAPAPGAKAKSLEGGGAGPVDYHLLMMFTKAEHNAALQAKARVALRSLLRLAKFETHEVLNLHFVSEEASREVAKGLLRELLPPAAGFKCKVSGAASGGSRWVAHPVLGEISARSPRGSGERGGRIVPELPTCNVVPDICHLPRRCCADRQALPRRGGHAEALQCWLGDLLQRFHLLPLGCHASDHAQRHTFWQFRHENPQTRVGGPPPEGLPGFNSGVMLLNLEAMRQSLLYSRLLEPAQVQQLADKYHFRGHLGDQDFFTMIGMEHPKLFHVLDCTWNRQLCTWWRDHGYSDVFEAYFQCEGHVKIYHGNCNTPIPED